MARHDRILVSPPRGPLVSEVLTAQGRANQEVSVLPPFDYFKWDALLRPLADSREGRKQWSDTRHGDTARVSVAWWTDHLGRRHYRVTGGNSRDGSCRNLSSTRKDPRPALWHVYPDRLFLRDRGKGAEWVAVCGCGEAGPPERLAWMGRTCGVCHDRAQEGEPGRLHVAVPALGPHQGHRRAVEFTPDGAAVATVRSLDEDGLSACVRLDEIAGDGWRELPEMNRGPNCLAFSPDGELLAGTDGDFGGLFIHDLATDEPVLRQPIGAPIVCLAFAPDGMSLAVGGPQGLQLWRRLHRGGQWELNFATERPAQALAWSPTSDALAVGGGGQVVLIGMVADRHETLLFMTQPDLSVGDLAFSDDGKALTCLSYSELRRWWPGFAGPYGLVQHRDAAASGEPTSIALAAISHGRLSPGGRWLAWVAPAESSVWVRPALATSEPARLAWDLDERLAAVVFSPDGETMATVGEEGTVKVIPWRLLLP